MITHPEQKVLTQLSLIESKKEMQSLRILLTDLVQNLKHNKRTDSAAFLSRIAIAIDRHDWQYKVCIEHTFGDIAIAIFTF